MTNKLARNAAIFFALILVHVSVLDFFFVTHAGPVFLWDRASEPTTIFTHITIALISTLVFVVSDLMHARYKAGAYRVREPILMFASAVMLIAISLLVLG